MKIRAKTEGREALYRRLRQLIPDAERELAVAQLEGAKELADKIKARAPRDTGRYAASILGDRLSSRPGEKAVGRGLRSQTKDPNAAGVFADYIWRFLEFGTVKMVKRPHVFPTYRGFKKRLRRKMARAVNRAVRRAKKA